ncbi:TonB family protein [Bacteroides ovatus]|uniref:TonB family protein n=1 Tax=Bacteroides ovatus TaxID=28116 RepID=UPI0032C148D0
MKSTIITLIMLMCCFTVVRAQEDKTVDEMVNNAILEFIGIDLSGRSSSNSNSNSNSKDEDADNQIYVSTEKIAEFPGGMNALFDFINRNLIYPKECISNNIEGRIMLKIIVEKDGRISAQVSESSKDRHPALIREALRLVSIMPRWTPAGYRGNSSKFINVRFQTYIPIVFRLRDGKYLPFVMPSEKSTQNNPLYKPASFISTKTFEEQILPNMNKAIILSFYAAWAKPCNELNRDWDTLFGTFNGKYRLCHIDVDNHEESDGLADRYEVSAIPTLILIYNRNGDFVNWRGYGKGSESAIKSWFEDGIRKAESYFGR